MESRTVIDTPNCIWKPKELIECSKSLACNGYGMVTLRPYSTNLINNIKTLNYEYR